MRPRRAALLILALLFAPRPSRAADAPPVSDPALTAWVSRWFAWGEGDVVLEKGTRSVPGWRVLVATKKFAAPYSFQDRADLFVSDDGRTVIVGSAFVDEERAAAPAPVASDADLGSVRAFLRARVLPQIRAKAALEPARDLPGFRALSIGVPTGYGEWALPAWVTAADGAVVVLGRAWRRDRSIAEQRKELVDLSGTPVQGPEGAKVTLVEYSDMQCPMCKKRSGELAGLLEKLKDALGVRRFVKTYPLTEIHPWSFRAASAARCLFQRDPALFFSFKSNVFSRQEDLDVAGLDALAFDFAAAHNALDDLRACYLQPASADRVLKDLSEGFSIGVRSTPSFFIDGVLVVWFDDPFLEEYLRKTYLGGKGLPIRTPTPAPTPGDKPKAEKPANGNAPAPK